MVSRSSPVVGAVIVAVSVWAVAMMIRETRRSEQPSKTLVVSVALSPTTLQITNTGSPEAAGRPVTIFLNDQPPFTYRGTVTLPPVGESLTVSLNAFTLKDGTRFNPAQTAVTQIWIGGGSYDYRKFAPQ